MLFILMWFEMKEEKKLRKSLKAVKPSRAGDNQADKEKSI